MTHRSLLTYRGDYNYDVIESVTDTRLSSTFLTITNIITTVTNTNNQLYRICYPIRNWIIFISPIVL